MKFDQIQVEKRLVSDPKDDERHVLRPSAVTKESIPYMIVLPDEKITCLHLGYARQQGRRRLLCLWPRRRTGCDF